MTISTFQTPSRVISGQGTISLLGKELRRLGASRVLLVIDPFLVQNGLAASASRIMETEGIVVSIFDGVEPDPRCEIPALAAQQAKKFKADAVVAIGGGSTLDIAKVASVLAVTDKDVRTFIGTDKIEHEGLKMVLIPTTAGTGSEVTNIAILSDEQAHLKLGVVSSRLIAHAVLLDPELTCGLPPSGTAASGLDALIHAIEAYTGNTATEQSDLYAEKAIRMISSNLRRAWARGDDMEARQAMLMGAFYAGLAFSNSGCAAVHAFAYPIGAEFHIPHGIANAIMLVPVLKRNIPSRMERYAAIAAMMGENIDGLGARTAAGQIIVALQELIADLRVDCHLSRYGVRPEHIPMISDSVMQVTRLLANNPYRITRADAEAIYTEAL